MALEAGLGQFFAAKFRSGVLYAIHEKTGDRVALEEALKAYRNARRIFAQVGERAKPVYVADFTVGERPHLKGNWLDRLPAIDGDIADMTKRLEATPATESRQDRARKAVEEALGRPQRIAVPVRHTAPANFRPGQALELLFSVDQGAELASATLYYRHVNQGERYETAEMQASQNRYAAAIPASYTASPYPLQYYFELRNGPNQAWLHPGFSSDRMNQPYFVVRRA